MRGGESQGFGGRTSGVPTLVLRYILCVFRNTT